jgi:N-acetylmuramoyl-L-alanine amidase
MRKLNEIIVHCAATPEGRNYTVDQIRSWHKKRGWNDIGYHFVIYLDGKTVAGRPLSKVGAHVAGKNTGTIGVCYVGGVAKDGKTPKDTRTPAQKRALDALLRKLLREHPTIKKISGHNQYAAKACPSFDAHEEYRLLTQAPKEQAKIKVDERVRYLQKLLALAGYYAGQHDGIEGEKTKAGLLAYQAEHGLKKTGRFDEQTVARLRLIERPVTKEEKAVIADAAATGRLSTTEIAAGVTTVGGAVTVAKEAADIAQEAKFTIDVLLGAGPWVLLGLVVIGAGVYIWRERSRKKKEARAAL